MEPPKSNPSLLETTLLLGSLTSALAYGLVVRAPPSRSRMVYKTASTALLSCLAASRTSSSSSSSSSPLVVAALALSSAGDAFLAWSGEEAFLRGLGSFLVAHLLYCVVLWRSGNGIRADDHGWRRSVAALSVVAAPAMSFALLPRVGPALRLPIVLYCTAILSMLLGAVTVRGSQVATGAVLFALSDSLLATEQFLLDSESRHRVWMQYAVWALYYSGQLLIVTGLRRNGA
ncbi:hypothetical protein L249_0663 [Ophiocordyceps polyrhachis-furcata BCC 54312]|uniref:YhhN-like protein n=1 Tax=Ophiocordyceps polyrhachis-furcata BCC 54312 TaxID=1330021 RepID=A0A367LE39_9HYPO|nr:hypothetical protein L249_0663 [Ophiocordyceps polyrhachis-furcata BCC 54312]